ncbi:hypothetical protein ZIOFF_074404 (mitochondrion) [Zingiber officinale]|uniref:DNA-directed RNA polymerase n=1 Tax=Zingiber officinale TaxID=94328 RepID=A0A8J5BWY7_ZINOF|nr:hypothetical protein ZIOFF_074404 [Zingiber officinale]
MCFILNGLQSQGFKRNTKVLENRDTLVKLGLLITKDLVNVNLSKAFDFMRKCYFNDIAVQEACSLNSLLMELAKKVQRARYEEFIIRLAEAYEGFVFYLPAFMDFRGRIYRSGILHFHERDLARSFILFSPNNQYECSKDHGKDFACAAAFKYKKFQTLDEAFSWYKEKKSVMYASADSLMSFSLNASDPFQFISKVLCHERFDLYNGIPMNQDASASAYQIMSSFLLNEDLARKTKIIPHPDGQIEDFDVSLLNEFQNFLFSEIYDSDKMKIIESKLDRKLVKTLFMPMIYGKSLISMADNIKEQYGKLLSSKDNYNLAKLCNEFMKEKYPDVVNLMKLIKLIAWVCAAKDLS